MVSSNLHQLVESFLSSTEKSRAIPIGAGIAVSVVKNGAVLLCQGRGLADRQAQVPVTPRTLFEICSLTKAFTAGALVMAGQEGRVDLKRPINLDRLLLPLKDPILTQEITIEDILAHRTGVPSHDLLWYFGALPSKHLVSALSEMDVLPGAYRREFNYSNLMYGALGQLFEPLLGESWEASISNRILRPLEMHSTFLNSKGESQGLACPYIGDRVAQRVDTSLIASAGSIRSSLEDMTRWMNFQLNGSKTASTLQEARIQVTAPNPLIFQGLEWLAQDLGYGYGWFVSTYAGRKIVFHPGLIDGYTSAMVLVPEEAVGVLVMTNLNLSSAPGLMIKALLDDLLLADEPCRFIGEYHNALYGSVDVEAAPNSKLTLLYRGRRWPSVSPLTWRDPSECEATFTMTTFGLDLPLQVRFEESEGERRLSMNLSLDSRVGPQIFIRRV